MRAPLLWHTRAMQLRLSVGPALLLAGTPRKTKQAQQQQHDTDLYDAKNYLIRGGQRAYEQKIANMNRAAIQARGPGEVAPDCARQRAQRGVQAARAAPRPTRR